ncbi:CMP-N,N'-diacetyllegionaminic acid synthase [compost metagenome]
MQSVVETTDHPYYLRDITDGFLMKIDKNDKRENLRRQDLEKVYRVNGAIYIANRELVMNQKTLTGEMNAAFIMDKTRSIDIDDILDFKLAELLLASDMC